MNILREVRRVKSRSVPASIALILLFSVILIITTYAWFSSQRDVTLGGLEGEVTSWDVAYFMNPSSKEHASETALFTIDQFYPGMPDREDKVYVYNMGESSTNIKYELISVKIFGEEVLNELKTSGEITTDTATNTTNIFSKDIKYPFNISYTYDKTYLEGNANYEDFITEDGYITSVEKNGQTITPPKALFRFFVNWDYDVINGTDAQNAEKDALDTKFGKDAYTFYQNPANDTKKAVEIKVKITSEFIHPNLES